MRRCNLNFIFILILIFQVAAFSQILPMGLYEGLMGNSGVATADSTAPSFYNPSLLTFKKSGSVVLGGNTISAIKTKTSLSDSTGSSFSPSYVSSIDAWDSFVHEFFIANITDADLNSEFSNAGNLMQSRYRFRNVAAGYSFAFPGFPIGFQTLLYNTTTYGVASIDNTDGTLRTMGNIRMDTSQVYAGIGISTILQFDSYSMGVNFRSRAAKIYAKDNSTYKVFLYDPTGPSFSASEGKPTGFSPTSNGNTIIVGHGFRSGAHEFLTDSSFVESPFLDQSYSWRQSYGYRLGIRETHQFLVGLNHLISDKVRYFGQDAYVSVGYSWKTRTYRSGFGLFYWNDRVTQNQNTSIYGLTFSSELSY